MRKQFTLILSVLFFSTPLFAQEQRPTVPLTLQQAEAIALKNNPQITIGKLQALVAQQQIREQRSALLPDVSINLTGVQSQPGSRVAAGGLNNSIIYPRVA